MKHCDQAYDCEAAQGCGVRKKTTIYEGEVVYKDQTKRVEQGLGREYGTGCEQIVTGVYQTYASGDTPLGCV